MSGETFTQSKTTDARMLNNEARSPLTTPPQTFKQRAWRYAPLLLFILLIYFNSTGAMSASSTGRILRPLLAFLFGELTDAQYGLVQSVIRKTAHFTQYAMLGWLSARAFSSSSREILRRNWFIVSLSLVAVIASLDEYHQSFVSSRSGSVYDVLIDITGGATALILIFAVRLRGKRR
jgi:VanZ family protein